MALKIVMVAKNPFALYRAKEDFVRENIENVVRIYGTSDRDCMMELRDGVEVYLVSESDWRRGSYARQQFDQIFRVGPEPLGIDFMLELQECLKGSCVPEEWQWQKWKEEPVKLVTEILGGPQAETVEGGKADG